jgi:hypothetical protein
MVTSPVRCQVWPVSRLVKSGVRPARMSSTSWGRLSSLNHFAASWTWIGNGQESMTKVSVPPGCHRVGVGGGDGGGHQICGQNGGP